MRAIVVEAGKAAVRDEPKPTPAKGEVLIRVTMAGICATDLEILKGYGSFQGIPGHEFVGVVEAGAAELKGKRVVGEINCVCGRCDMCQSGLSNHCRRRTVLGITGRPGAFAEYLTLPQRNCHVVSDSLSNEEAVFTEPLAAAYQITKQMPIDSKMNVAVLGTGRLGLLVAQVLATTRCKLIAIGRNPRTLSLLDRKRIRTSTVAEIKRAQDHDVVVECTGSPDGLALAHDLVRPRGTIILKTTCSDEITLDLSPLVVNEITLLGSRCGPFSDALGSLARKQVDVLSMVTKRVSLEDGPAALAEAAQPDQIKVLLKVADS